MWGKGLVPGHGVFQLIRVNESITVGELRIQPNELLIADMDGCVKVPAGLNPALVLDKAKEIFEREGKLHAFMRKPGLNQEKLREFLKDF